MENKIYAYSSSPHVKSQRTTRQIMTHVLIALLPACVMGCVYFGFTALAIIGLSLASAFLSEVIYLLILKKDIKTIIKEFDCSSLVTGLLIALTIGTNYPLYTPVIGTIFAIIVVKMIFGGTGKNIVNPAICGRIFIFISFQAMATAWLMPSIGSIIGIEVTTSATELTNMFETTVIPNLPVLDLLLGTGLRGCIGETCKVALLIGLVYLSVMKIIKIQYPLIFIAVEGLFATALYGFDFSYFLPSILTGGLFIGAIFMATDYVTTPDTKLGNYIYFVCLGLLTAGLRMATKMEAVSFAILLMNLVVPLIDKFIISKPFGFIKTNNKGVK